MTGPVESILAKLDLKSGGHRNFDEGACLLEAAVADAAADAAADADADAAADKYSARWYEVFHATYDAVYAKLRPIYDTELDGSKYAEARRLNIEDGIELLGRLINPKEASK